MGRPSAYKPEYAKKLIEHMQRGFSFKSFGGEVLKSERTLFNWIEAHPDFKEAREIGECCCLLHWEKAGMGNAKETDRVLWIVNMCNRFGWKQKTKDDQGEAEALTSKPDVVLSNDALLKLVDQARGGK